MKRQIILVIIMVLFLMGLAGCTGGNTETDAVDPGEAASGSAVVRSDADGLVEVRIEGGKAELTFNLEQWDKLYGIYSIYDTLEHTDPALLREGPFEINFDSGAGCKDVCIATIPSLNAAFYEFSTVTVIFLMEDGTVEHLPVFPYPDEKNAPPLTSYTTYGALPWIKGIASLSYEQEDEGIGDMTIYATDEDGRRYDIRDFWHLSNVFDCEWVYNIAPEFNGDVKCMILSFHKDGTVSLREAWRYSREVYASLTGRYTVSGSFVGGKPVLLLELWNEADMDMSNPDFTLPHDLMGEYFFTSDDEYLTLYLIEDGALANYPDGSPVLVYPLEREWVYDDSYGGGDEFNFGYSEAEYGIADYSDDELIDYLLEHVEKAREMVQDLGMAALVTGETEEFMDAGVCRLVILGTNHPEQFVREIYYAISPYYCIYEQDPVYGNWSLVYEEFPVS